MSVFEVFDFEGIEVCIVVIDGKLFFVGCDVVIVFGYVDVMNVLKQYCCGVVIYYFIVDVMGCLQMMCVIGELDLLCMIVNS